MPSILSIGRTAVPLNGVPEPWIPCHRGLCQGEPLSPYLFIVIADLLHRMITDVVATTVMRHLLVDDLECPAIQYVDDTLVLLWAEEAQVCRLKVVLNSFVAATGLGINFSKSTFIPINVDDEHAGTLAAILGCTIGGSP
jgi:hypothetical protein